MQAKGMDMRIIIPICCGCGSIREEDGHWNREADFRPTIPSNRLSHGICPDCIGRLYPEAAEILARRRLARESAGPKSYLAA
jgi:hypothetical protein